MKPSSVIKLLNYCVERQRPVFLWGSPGVGKSDVVAQVAARRNIELRDVRLSLLDPVDLKGYPVPDTAKKQMKWLPANFLPTRGSGVLFLDEMNSAPPSVQAAAYQLVLNRRIGDYELPDGWAVIAAGNRDSDRAVTHRMPSALANRLVHVDFEVSLEDWSAWATEHDIQPEVLAFLRFKPTLLHSFDSTANPRAFPSPRSWSFVSELFDARETLTPGEFLEAVKGTVGEGAASEFIAFINLCASLPTYEEILANPETVAIPSSPGVMYALSTGLPQRVKRTTFDQVMKFVTRMPIEFQVVFIRDALLRCDEVFSTKSFVNWSIAHGDFLK